jgi:hypothetical protein
MRPLKPIARAESTAFSSPSAMGVANRPGVSHITMAYIRSTTQEPPGSIGIAREDPGTRLGNSRKSARPGASLTGLQQSLKGISLALTDAVPVPTEAIWAIDRASSSCLTVILERLSASASRASSLCWKIAFATLRPQLANSSTSRRALAVTVTNFTRNVLPGRVAVVDR